jgi:hypothetical protein
MPPRASPLSVTRRVVHPGDATAKERTDVQAMLFVRLGPLRVLSQG